MKQLILASGSPRRRELLEKCDIPFICIPADIDESIDETMPLGEEIGRLSRRKAEHILQEYPDAVVIGSDTIVTADGRILGKPADRQEAAAMLRLLSGRAHQVITGLTVISSRRSYTAYTVSDVHFAEMDENDINTYLDTGECMDKAGAYGIQGYGGRYIEKIEGDFYSIMGLPLHLVFEELKHFDQY